MLVSLTNALARFKGLVYVTSGLIVYRLLSAVYSVTLLLTSLSILGSEKYGLLSLALVKYALMSRIVAFGFDYVAKEIVEDEKFSYIHALVAKSILYLVFLCILFWYGPSEFLLVSVVSGCLYCFEIVSFYQAKQALERLAYKAVAVYSLSVIMLGGGYYWDFLTPTAFFALITIPPSIVWFLHFLSLATLRGGIDIDYSLNIIKRSTPMAFVAQIPGSYSNIIPLLIGTQSIKMAGVFYFLMRVSNLGKMIGLMINQTMYYSKSDLNRSSALIFLNATSVFVVVLVGCFLANAGFSDKLHAIYEQRYFIFLTVSFLTFNSVIGSYVIANVFIKESLYFQYLCTAVVVIGAAMMTFWLENDYTIIRGLTVHIIIELGLLVSAMIFSWYKNHGSRRRPKIW